jgi:hypothetical protein
MRHKKSPKQVEADLGRYQIRRCCADQARKQTNGLVFSAHAARADGVARGDRLETLEVDPLIVVKEKQFGVRWP